jgi:hypothetical protein
MAEPDPRLAAAEAEFLAASKELEKAQAALAS